MKVEYPTARKVGGKMVMEIMEHEREVDACEDASASASVSSDYGFLEDLKIKIMSANQNEQYSKHWLYRR